jgi:RHS repeat-associated protein
MEYSLLNRFRKGNPFDGGTIYINKIQYGPANGLQQMTYFGSTETRQYNNRLQMTHLTMPGQLNISYNFAAQNNGQISSQTDNLSGEQITYQYDALKRLYSASASAWSQTFTYDGFSNLTDKAGTGGAPTNHSPVNAATNQLTGYSYDANGNMTTTGYGWDPENRMSYATWGGTQYAYDSANKRIWTGNYTCPGGFCGPGYGWQFQSETVFFYGIDGNQLAAYTPQVQYSYGTPQSIYYLLGEERVYFRRKYIGNANTTLMSGGTSVGQDRLGSTGKYFPYGEERNNSQLPNDTVKFATYTRDSATGLDYADQRYYTGGVGRFMNPDPYRASASSVNNPTDPATWNRYAYVGGDPINRADPGGQCWIEVPHGEPIYIPCQDPFSPGGSNSGQAQRRAPYSEANAESQTRGGRSGSRPGIKSKKQAPDTLNHALLNMSPHCKQVLPVVEELGAVGSEVTYYDARPEADGNMSYDDLFGSGGPVTLATLDGTLDADAWVPRQGITVILGSSFFSQSGDRQEQTLLHEVLHVDFNLKFGYDKGTDAAIVAYYNARDALNAMYPALAPLTLGPSVVLDLWLRSDCPSPPQP